ncbi:MAG TPA: DUF3047 domain-containing protein [Methylococcaceae bacterium]|nr:DUF3047 domain-containing protein [Methylococcaceae bacterium]
MYRLSCLLLCFAAVVAAAGLRIPVGEFSQGRLVGWETKIFQGETRYGLMELDGRAVLKAESRGTASGLVRKMAVDLENTPYLHWSWRAENTLGKLNERTKSGDDYPARLYVVVSGALAFWRTRSLNYVWASALPAGSAWPNAFAGQSVRMLALRSGEEETGRWHEEKRNVRDDLKRYFKEDIRQIDAVALMTDTDNTGGQAVAYYGDIYFASE